MIGQLEAVRRAGSRPPRFGLQIFGSEGIIQTFDTGHLPEMHFPADPIRAPGRTGKQWVPITSAGPGQPEPLENPRLHDGNLMAVEDLIEAVEQDRLPLANRENPLTMPR